MKKLSHIAIIAAFTIFSGASHAGTSTGKVTFMIINSTNYLFFIAGVKTESPTCGNNSEWAINLGSAQGKALYALLLSAQAQDKTVSVVGNGTCSIWADREDVLYAAVY
ncbi:MAG: hypothetical protein LWW96_05060 [Acidovorax sp.]|uniref:hypothetical protein n=1 Tax=Acidovorax sp. TaxID=1872122 RepID=UPI0025B87B48|nr:hypothetical protein [Acidovorax sp.]MCE1191506.1 hypothetical protein [Acidovorax sp.]